MTVRKVTKIDSYIDDSDVDVDVLEIENEEEFSPRSSTVQSGWAGAQKLFANNATKPQNKTAWEFKVTEEPQVIKFLDADPIPFVQHWVPSRSGRKSFLCIDPDGSDRNCPLCKIFTRETREMSEGKRARRSVERRSKVSFNVIGVGSEDGPAVQLLECGSRLFQQLERLHSDPKTGPLPKLFWAISRSGQSLDTMYHLTPIKARDLADDWDVDPEAFMDSIADVDSLTFADLKYSTKEELQEIADEIDS
jgi:hypothetical protein